MTTDHILGREGEKLACDFLTIKGFEIIEKNWHSGKYGEIDIIAMDKNTNELVFVEVKTRDTSIDDAKELVTRKKQEKLFKLAESYLYIKHLQSPSCRFDVIAIKINKNEKKLEHIKNAFYASHY